MKKFKLVDYNGVIKDWTEYEPLTPKQIILAMCTDCCAYQPSEVKACTSMECPAWLFRQRFYKTPKHSGMSEEQRLAASERLKAFKISKNEQR